MHVLARLGLLILGAALPATAQTTCPSFAEPARSVEALRKQLHRIPIRDDSPVVSGALASQLTGWKDALAQAADAAFGCAPAAVLPETLQNTLAEGLHANLPANGESDTPVYGSDLTVQVFQLFGKPKLFYVDFRYGVACGDDHLLLVYQTASDAATDGWHRWLRWNARGYTNVGNAFGDFVLLAPLTGNDKAPVWRFLVAHGQPGCADTPRPSHFDLDLLTPTADPAKPVVTWHFERPYTAGVSTPRLATTENTIDFRLTPNDANGSRTSSRTGDEYRFRLTAKGEVEPLPMQTDEGPLSAPADASTPSAQTHSPQ